MKKVKKSAWKRQRARKAAKKVEPDIIFRQNSEPEYDNSSNTSK